MKCSIENKRPARLFSDYIKYIKIGAYLRGGFGSKCGETCHILRARKKIRSIFVQSV